MEIRNTLIKKKTLLFDLNLDKTFVSTIEADIFNYENKLNNIIKMEIPEKKNNSCDYCKKKIDSFLYECKLCNFCLKYCCPSCLFRKKIEVEYEDEILNICNYCTRKYYINLLNKIFYITYEDLNNIKANLDEELYKENNKLNSSEKILLKYKEDNGLVDLDKNLKKNKKNKYNYEFSINSLENEIIETRLIMEKKYKSRIKSESIAKMPLDNIKIAESHSYSKIEKTQNKINFLKKEIKDTINLIKNKILKEESVISEIKSKKTKKEFRCKCSIF